MRNKIVRSTAPSFWFWHAVRRNYRIDFEAVPAERQRQRRLLLSIFRRHQSILAAYDRYYCRFGWLLVVWRCLNHLLRLLREAISPNWAVSSSGMNMTWAWCIALDQFRDKDNEKMTIMWEYRFQVQCSPGLYDIYCITDTITLYSKMYKDIKSISPHFLLTPQTRMSTSLLPVFHL